MPEEENAKKEVLKVYCESCESVPFCNEMTSYMGHKSSGIARNMYRIKALEDAAELDDVKFIKKCELCPDVKRIGSYEFGTKLGKALKEQVKKSPTKELIERADLVGIIESETWDCRPSHKDFNRFRKEYEKENENRTGAPSALDAWVEMKLKET